MNVLFTLTRHVTKSTTRHYRCLLLQPAVCPKAMGTYESSVLLSPSICTLESLRKFSSQHESHSRKCCFWDDRWALPTRAWRPLLDNLWSQWPLPLKGYCSSSSIRIAEFVTSYQNHKSKMQRGDIITHLLKIIGIGAWLCQMHTEVSGFPTRSKWSKPLRANFKQACVS